MDFQEKTHNTIVETSIAPALGIEGTNELDDLKNVPQIVKGSPTAEIEPHSENFDHTVEDRQSAQALSTHIDQPPEDAQTE